MKKIILILLILFLTTCCRANKYAGQSDHLRTPQKCNLR